LLSFNQIHFLVGSHFCNKEPETKQFNMKNVKVLGLIGLVAGFMACNNDANNTAAADSTSKDSSTATTTTTTTSNVNYAAMADSFQTNSAAGNYLDAKTGKPIKIRYDVEKHRAVNEATGEPVWRYVDKRNWWVYGDNNDRWDTVGTAKMQGNNILYHGDNDSWVTYDERWKADDERMMSGDSNSKVSDNGNKIKDANGKIKVADDGNKIKVNDTKVKVKKDGEVKDKSDKH
jgi:hypothetical protein